MNFIKRLRGFSMYQNNINNEMYRKGYDNATICFAYVPDFKNDKDKQDYTKGYRDGLIKRGVIKE